MTEFKQIIGRGTRVRDDYGKLFFTILDYTGSATRLFADPDFDGDPVVVIETQIDEEGEPIGERESSRKTTRATRRDRGSGGRPSCRPSDDERRAPQVLRRRRPVEIAAHLVYELDPDGKQLARRAVHRLHRREGAHAVPLARTTCARSGPTPCSAPRSSRRWRSAASTSTTSPRGRPARRRPARPALPPGLQRAPAHAPRARPAPAQRAQGLLRAVRPGGARRSSTSCSTSTPSYGAAQFEIPDDAEVPPITASATSSRSRSCSVARSSCATPWTSDLQALLYACLVATKDTRNATVAREHEQERREQPLTTAQQLGSLIKSARDIMRKDKGLNSDLDRLPMLTWIMFLKFLDDMEQIEEAERAAALASDYRPAIEPPYRWRDWAAKDDGITGAELLAFINQDECTAPDGTRGLGLLAYLRSLQNAQRRDRRRASSAPSSRTSPTA